MANATQKLVSDSLYALPSPTPQNRTNKFAIPQQSEVSNATSQNSTNFPLTEELSINPSPEGISKFNEKTFLVIIIPSIIVWVSDVYYKIVLYKQKKATDIAATSAALMTGSENGQAEI